MRIFDAHCDVLYKMFKNPSIKFQNSASLQVNGEQLTAANVKIQGFAIYVSPNIHPNLLFDAALHMVELFYEKIIKPNPFIKLITRTEHIDMLDDDQVGAILTLEGCDAIGRDLLKLKTLLRLGVSSVGLTWNNANSVADGALEERGGGLTQFGKEVIRLLNETNTWCDISHLSEKGFWDVIEWGNHPFASHSNCYSLCPHPRNLKNDQIKAIIERDSVMGVTFVPQFLSGQNEASIIDVLRHVEHICELGGENHIGFGSDFDGTEHIVSGLTSIGDYFLLINELQKYYSEIQVSKFLYENMKKRYPRRI
ncbi:dipeptidase [Neobacillus sp. PS3-40]|uniref:dipeptidase n=1 Tax=Neobacillus sp. PS3-40 TaxID=3070679 RepID=UPI0027E215E1|nr:dipeptidase [Neobacillus sp. PS3-40]WML46502.1 dipeptidase [Neobacillus sp. PS3-40]